MLDLEEMLKQIEELKIDSDSPVIDDFLKLDFAGRTNELKEMLDQLSPLQDLLFTYMTDEEAKEIKSAIEEAYSGLDKMQVELETLNNLKGE